MVTHTDTESRNRTLEYDENVARKYQEKSWDEWLREGRRAAQFYAPEMYRRGYQITHWQPQVTDATGTATINVSARDAWRYRFIQLMPVHCYNLIPADLDIPMAEERIRRLCERGDLQYPHYITTNPLTGHAQAGWILASPVHRENDYRKAQISEDALCLYDYVRLATWRILGADLNLRHDGLLRNMTRGDQRTIYSVRLTPYMLSELITPKVSHYMKNDQIVADQIGFHGMPKIVDRYNPDGESRRVSKSVTRRARRAQSIGVANIRSRNRERDEKMVARRQQGKTLQQIADEFDLAVSTVRQTLKRPEFAKRVSTRRKPGIKAYAESKQREFLADDRLARRFTALTLRDDRGLSFSEIGKRLGISQQAASKLYRRAKSEYESQNGSASEWVKKAVAAADSLAARDALEQDLNQSKLDRMAAQKKEIARVKARMSSKRASELNHGG